MSTAVLTGESSLVGHPSSPEFLPADVRIRRIIIKNEEGRTLLEVPLTIGLIGAALLPVLAAIGAAAAIATRCTLVVEREHAPPGGEAA